jgi:hypothetical protein
MTVSSCTSFYITFVHFTSDQVHFFSTWVYSHVPVSFFQYMSLQSCTRFISPVHAFTVMHPFHFSSTWVYSHVPVSILQYMSLQSCTRFISTVHEFTVMYPFHFFSKRVYSHLSVSFLQYISLHSFTHFISPVHVLKKWNGYMTKLMYWRTETDTWL